jgi:LPXTG-site transpeptidase (sortase) family protein
VNKNFPKIRLLSISVLFFMFLSLSPGDGLASQNTSTQHLAVLQQWSLTAPDAYPQDEFGYSVDVSEGLAVIGARNADPGTGLINAGAAYVYFRGGSNWIFEAKLMAPDAQVGDSFGTSVAVSGDSIVVGSPGAEDEEGSDVGAAYVFTRSETGWNFQTKLTAADPLEDDGFGTAVAIDGNTIAVGANLKPAGPLPAAGAVYVFIRSGGRSWNQQAKLASGSPEIGDLFGTSMALDGKTLLVGAPETNPFGPTRPGEVYLFQRIGSKWNQVDRFRAKLARSGDGFGKAVALDGETIVVGADRHDPAGESGRIRNAGAAFVFTQSSGGWAEQAVLLAADAALFDNFGSSVDIYQNTIVVGAPGKYQAGQFRVGAAYLFTRSRGAWTQQFKTVTDPVAEDDAFGGSIALYGDWFFVGADGRDPDSLLQAGETFAVYYGASQLPDTGFTPGRVTALGRRAPASAYERFGDLWLEIPSIDASMDIIGVPRTGNAWDVAWLDERAGYLAETAFPTWQGNTGIAGHSVLANGLPGPFAQLDELRWGQVVIIHAWGSRYVYSVRSNSLYSPFDLDVLSHEDLDWVTLITCQGYNETLDRYDFRRVVRAVLVSVKPE